MRRKRGRSDHASWCLGLTSAAMAVCALAGFLLIGFAPAGKSPAKLRAADWPALRHVSHGFCRTYPVWSAL